MPVRVRYEMASLPTKAANVEWSSYQSVPGRARKDRGKKIYNLGKMPVTIAEIQGIRKNLLWCKEEGASEGGN